MVIRKLLLLFVLSLMAVKTLAAEAAIFNIKTLGDDYTLGQNISVTAKTDRTSAWVRQQIRVWIEIKTDDKFASLQLSDLSLPGFTVIPMRATRIQGDDGQATRLQAGWLLYSSRHGSMDISLPVINYIRGGKVQQQIKLPELQLDIRPLPPYVPPTMPVGEISVSSKLLQGKLLKQGSVYQWQIQLRSAESPPNSFTPVLRQLRQAGDLTFFPADTAQQLVADTNGINASVTHNIPFKSKTNGIPPLPKLRIQYFDPETGKIVTTYHDAGNVVSLHVAAWLLLVLAGMFFVYQSGKIALMMLMQFRERRKLRIAAINSINQASTPAQLRLALRNYATAMGWKANISLGQCAELWPVKKTSVAVLASSAAALSQLSFSRHNDVSDFATIKQAFIQALSVPG